MRFVIGGDETDLEVHYMAYAMRLCGLDHGNYGDSLDLFDNKYGAKLDDIFVDIDDIVLPMLDKVKKLSEPNDWFEGWLPVATPYIGCDTNVDDPDDTTFYCILDSRRELYFDNIKEVKIVDRIAYLVNKHADGKVETDFVVDAFEEVIKDRQFMNSIDRRIKAVYFNPKLSGISQMNIMGRKEN